MGVFTVSPHSDFTESDPLFLTHLHQTWNTETIGFNCVYSTVLFVHIPVHKKTHACVCALFPPGFSIYIIFYVIFAPRYNLVHRA